MSFQEPDVFSLNAPSQVKEELDGAYYYKEYGLLRGASGYEKLTYLAMFMLPAAFTNALFFFVYLFLLDSKILLTLGYVVTAVILFLGILYYRDFGYKKEHEYWVRFDAKDSMIVFTRRDSDGWEITEIPYEEIDEIRWIGGEDGRIELRSGDAVFHTYREGSKRIFSPTEVWELFAVTEAPMRNWPIILTCTKCGRQFGHHNGTATCPFDEGMILIDFESKGRIDSEQIRRSDLDRV